MEGNAGLEKEPGHVRQSPYKEGWVCRILPSDLTAELGKLRIGKPVLAWYSEEIVKLRQGQIAAGKPVEDVEWSTLQSFLV